MMSQNHNSQRARPAGRSRDPSLSKSPYLQLCSDLNYRYPILTHLISFIKRKSTVPLYPVRATVLEFHSSSIFPEKFEGSSGIELYEKLRHYLSSPKTCQHRLFLVEDLDPHFIELLGGCLNVDGTVFASQIRDTHFSGGPWKGHTPSLPSVCNRDRGWTIRYYEARLFDDPDLAGFSSSMQTVGNIQRQVTLGKDSASPPLEWNTFKAQPCFVGHIRRNTSFWSQRDPTGGWDAIMLFDPAIPKDGPNFTFFESFSSDWDRTRTSLPEKIDNQHFQRGYRDFTPWPSTPVTQTSQWAPHRDSLIDDITYYWTTVATPTEISSAIESPFNSATFQLSIVASIWMNALEHIHATLSESETLLWDLERMIEPHLSDAKKEMYMGRFTRALNEVNTLRRRLGWYVTEMEQNLYALGFDSQSPNPFDHEKNFLAIQKRLLNYQAWAEKLMGVITSHVNLMETEKSISDSKSLGRLTVLGFVFLPVSFVATFFSMGGDFAVGERRFWVFWVVAAVVTIVVCGVGFGKYWEMKWFGWRADRNEGKKA